MKMTAERAADIRARDAKLRAWMGKRNSYKQEELPADIVPPTNQERSACEVFEFLHDPPTHYFLYVSMAKNDKPTTVGTWTGDILGHSVQLGYVFKSNMGDERRSIRFTGINGKRYSGTYFCGRGDYARVRMNKKQ